MSYHAHCYLSYLWVATYHCGTVRRDQCLTWWGSEAFAVARRPRMDSWHHDVRSAIINCHNRVGWWGSELFEAFFAEVQRLAPTYGLGPGTRAA